jgi:pimeloyl-ACP methyl ester carboxylesterase
VPALLNGNRLVAATETAKLATLGRPVKAVAADSAARVVLRIPANTANQNLTVSLLEDNLAGRPASEVGMLCSVGGTENLGTLPVVAQQTGQGPMAFAVYYPPADFVRAQPGYSGDNSKASRTIQFSVASQSGSLSYSSPIELLRPPIVLVHGFWDSQHLWNSFPLYRNLAWNNNDVVRFSIERANYDIPLTATWGSPTADTTDWSTTYLPSDLAKANANQLSFTYNAPRVFNNIQDAIADFRNGGNVLGKPAAAAQADVVAHSMGGLVAREISMLPQYLGNESFAVGNIHKLITIGTPHYGSPFATQALQDPAIESVFAQFQDKLVFGWGVVLSGRLGVVPGAAYDMLGDANGTGGGLSPNLAALNNTAANPKALPVAEIAGAVDPDINLKGLSSGWRKVQKPLAQITGRVSYGCGPCTIEAALSAGSWPSLFNRQPSDGMVAVTSQLATSQTCTSGVPGIIHSPSLEALGFAGPGEIEEQNYIPNAVIFLLNQPVGSVYFVKF